MAGPGILSVSFPAVQIVTQRSIEITTTKERDKILTTYFEINAYFSVGMEKSNFDVEILSFLPFRDKPIGLCLQIT